MILIIQNGNYTPSISRYLDDEHKIIKSFEMDVNEIDLDDYSLTIILGGCQSVTEINSFPYLLNVMSFIKTCIDTNKPLIGICLGSQLIAHVLGCTIKSSNKLNIGYDIKILGVSNVFRCHIDYIVPNDYISVIEYFDSMPYFYKHKDHVYGIQCHPDITPESVISISNHPESILYAKNNKEMIDKNNKKIITHIIEKINNKDI